MDASRHWEDGCHQLHCRPTPLPSPTHWGSVLVTDPPSHKGSRSQFTEQGQSTSKNDEDFCVGVFNKLSRHLHTFLWKQHIRKLKLAFQKAAVLSGGGELSCFLISLPAK